MLFELINISMKDNEPNRNNMKENEHKLRGASH
jgi:hypothetical protein